MTHWADNYETVGRIRIISTSVTETRPGIMMNNQASESESFGGSLRVLLRVRLVKNNMEVEAAMELQRHLDETGAHRVCTIYVGGVLGFAPCSTEVCFLKQVHQK